MGTVHKFKRPPKNENQFKGYRPMAPTGPRRLPGRWSRLRPWQRSLLAWMVLITLVSGFVGLRMAFVEHRGASATQGIVAKPAVELK